MAASNTVQPESFSKRSFLHHTLRERAARFQEVGDGAIVSAYDDERAEVEQARYSGLADLSPLARVGFKGPNVVAWLANQKADIPGESNSAVAQNDGSVAARLSPTEMVVLDDLRGERRTIARLCDAWREAAPESSLDFMPPRQDSHAWFALVGTQGADTLAKLCAVDVRPAKFGNGSVAQTSVARVGAIIIRHDLGPALNYHLLVDSASAVYFWDCLLDAMAEFNGKPVGFAAMRNLESSKANS